MSVTRVYLARLAGVAIYDPIGDLIGRVRDAVARWNALDLQPSPERLSHPPHVVGLIAQLPMRRRIFLPMGRVLSIDADAVALGSGTISLRRFERRPGELLVLEDLLDRQVEIPTQPAGPVAGPVATPVAKPRPGAVATVVDVGMDRDRTGDWGLTRVAVREYTGRLTRRGRLHQLEWGEVVGLAEPVADTQGTASLLATLEDLRPADLAHALQEMPPSRRDAVARALEDERLADVLGELPEHVQVEILAGLDRQRAAEILEEMDPDDAADLLGELAQPDREELLGLMQPQEASPVRALLAYHPGTAGSLMTSEPVILTPDATVAEALARVREQQLTPAIAAQVFVSRAPMATPTGRYLGMVHFQRLLREPPATQLGAIVDRGIDPLTPATTMAEITHRMATYNLVGIAVVDASDRLVGAVTVDDVLDHLLPRDWRERDPEPDYG